MSKHEGGFYPPGTPAGRLGNYTAENDIEHVMPEAGIARVVVNLEIDAHGGARIRSLVDGLKELGREAAEVRG